MSENTAITTKGIAANTNEEILTGFAFTTADPVAVRLIFDDNEQERDWVIARALFAEARRVAGLTVGDGDVRITYSLGGYVVTFAPPGVEPLSVIYDEPTVTNFLIRTHGLAPIGRETLIPGTLTVERFLEMSQ